MWKFWKKPVVAKPVEPVEVLPVLDMGAALRCPVGTHGRLRLMLSSTTFIAMDIVVARVQGSQLGLQCTHIDLDSVTHLRQLIERNAQDPALLGRELAMLIGSA
ncbi:MAG: PilZ domain-containing protein [Burkholderiales bacterium]|nr:PilZ domain-containing protein [Burkholderiales bacterium]